MSKALAALGVTASLALASCGIPTDQQPRALPVSQVPFGLLGNPTGSGSPPGHGTPTSQVRIYLLRSGLAVPIERQLTDPASLNTALAALLAGPTPTEVGSGITSALTGATSVAGVTTNPQGAATISLSGDFGHISGAQLVMAVAQMVLTATAVPGVTSVQFTLDGRPVQVPKGDGTLADRPLTRADFSALTRPF